MLARRKTTASFFFGGCYRSLHDDMHLLHPTTAHPIEFRVQLAESNAPIQRRIGSS